jgi:hypothetical protein
MKSNNKGTSLKFAVFLLPMFLITPAGQAVEPTHWDAMKGNYDGSITITANSGRQVKGTGSVFFAPDAVTFAGVSYSRGDVKEVVIRRPRTWCCEPLQSGVLLLLLVVGSIGDHDFSKDEIPVFIALSPVIVGAAAVTGPPLLIIEGIRRLKPAKVLYDVVP